MDRSMTTQRYPQGYETARTRAGNIIAEPRQGEETDLACKQSPAGRSLYHHSKPRSDSGPGGPRPCEGSRGFGRLGESEYPPKTEKQTHDMHGMYSDESLMYTFHHQHLLECLPVCMQVDVIIHCANNVYDAAFHQAHGWTHTHTNTCVRVHTHTHNTEDKNSSSIIIKRSLDFSAATLSHETDQCNRYLRQH